MIEIPKTMPVFQSFIKVISCVYCPPGDLHTQQAKAAAQLPLSFGN